MQPDLPTSPPENMSVPRGGTGYSVFISSLSITSLLCDANGWPHLQGLSVSFITVTESIVTRPGLCNAASHGRGSQSGPLSLVDAQMVGSAQPHPPCSTSCCDLPDRVRRSVSVEKYSCSASPLRCQPSSLPVSFISCASSTSITWEPTASRRRLAFSPHLISIVNSRLALNPSRIDAKRGDHRPMLSCGAAAMRFFGNVWTPTIERSIYSPCAGSEVSRI